MANILRILEVDLPLNEMRNFDGMGYIRNKNDNAILIMSPWGKKITLKYLIEIGFLKKKPAIDGVLINFEDIEEDD